jgi:hypothetical protein
MKEIHQLLYYLTPDEKYFGFMDKFNNLTKTKQILQQAI